MARLPTPGSDEGQWGAVLNDFLQQSHTSTGTLKPDVVTASSLQDNSVAGASLQPNAVTADKLSAPGGATGEVLVRDTGVSGGFKWDTVGGGGAPSGAAGGDLGGTYPNPTVPALANKQPLDTNLTAFAALTPTNDDILQRKAGVWTNRTPTQIKADLTLTKTDVGLSNVDNTSDANKPVSTAQQTAINLKATDTTVVHNTGTETIAGVKTFSSSPIVPTPTNGTDVANKTYADTKQTSNSNLTAFAGLTPTNDDILQRKAGAWTNRTPAQVKTDLALVKADVGLSNADNTSDTNKPVSTATQTALNLKENTITATTTAQYYRGDKTFQNLDKTAVGLTNVDNTSDANKPVSTATQTALNLKADASTVGAKTLLINDAGSLPPGTPAGVIVVVKAA